MAFEFHFLIDPLKIRLQDFSTEFQLELDNRIIYCRKDERKLAAGKAEYEVQARLRGASGLDGSEIGWQVHYAKPMNRDAARSPVQMRIPYSPSDFKIIGTAELDG